MTQVTTYIIIDDDPTNNLICRMTIGRADPGKVVISFTDPEEGLNYFRETKFNGERTILFLDLNMPLISGWDVLDALRGEAYEHVTTEIYVLTSSISEKDRDQAINGFHTKGFISKPLTTAHLQEILS